MLRAPEHQVAGHQARDGQLGPLVDASGRFYKPLQGEARGDREASFYVSFSCHPRVPPHVRRFFPGFHGIQLVPASDGSGPQPHLVLDDLLVLYSAPSLTDIKIGACTWPPSSSDDYLLKCLAKDRHSTSLPLGFRISGLQIHHQNAFFRPAKNLIKRFDAAAVRRALRQFVSANDPASSDADPDCALASSIYGGSEGILSQLLELKAWFEDQTLFHFYSASVLMVHERKPATAIIRLVDFAHVEEGNEVIDHNFLGGLCSLIKFVSEILTGPGPGPSPVESFQPCIARFEEEEEEPEKTSRSCVEN